MLVPKDFTPPILKTSKYIARKLTVEDTELDYQAVMSSIGIIHKTRGGKWPTPELTLEKDRIDLLWHQEEFESNSSFAYTVMNVEETECLGCIYFYPPKNTMSDASRSDNPNTEVEISWWVTQKMYDEGFYEILSFDIKKWVETQWPFKNIYWANKELPVEFQK